MWTIVGVFPSEMVVFRVPVESCRGTTGLLLPLGEDLGELGSNRRSESATWIVKDSDIFPAGIPEILQFFTTAVHCWQRMNNMISKLLQFNRISRNYSSSTLFDSDINNRRTATFANAVKSSAICALASKLDTRARF